MKNLKYFFKKAEKEKWAIGQFNFSTLEQFKGIIEAAKKLNSPIILGTSINESHFIGLSQAVALVKLAQKETGLPIFLNLDHALSFSYTKKAIDLGYQAVHFDGSKITIDENIKITKQIVKYAHQKNVLIEGEIDIVGGDLTNPEQAKKFVQETKVDSLAVNIGTAHGIQTSGKDFRINLKRLKEIKDKTKNTYLILHGGSGTSEKDIKSAIRLGIVKININTETRMAYTNTLRKTLNKNLKEIIPYKYLPEVVTAVQKKVEEKIKLFGSNNKI